MISVILLLYYIIAELHSIVECYTKPLQEKLDRLLRTNEMKLGPETQEPTIMDRQLAENGSSGTVVEKAIPVEQKKGREMWMNDTGDYDYEWDQEEEEVVYISENENNATAKNFSDSLMMNDCVRAKVMPIVAAMTCSMFIIN